MTHCSGSRLAFVQKKISICDLLVVFVANERVRTVYEHPSAFFAEMRLLYLARVDEVSKNEESSRDI